MKHLDINTRLDFAVLYASDRLKPRPAAKFNSSPHPVSPGHKSPVYALLTSDPNSWERWTSRQTWGPAPFLQLTSLWQTLFVSWYNIGHIGDVINASTVHSLRAIMARSLHTSTVHSLHTSSGREHSALSGREHGAPPHARAQCALCTRAQCALCARPVEILPSGNK